MQFGQFILCKPPESVGTYTFCRYSTCNHVYSTYQRSIFSSASRYVSASYWVSDNFVESLHMIQHVASAMGNMLRPISYDRACVIYGTKRLGMRVRYHTDTRCQKFRKKVWPSESIRNGIDSIRKQQSAVGGRCYARGIFIFWSTLSPIHRSTSLQ